MQKNHLLIKTTLPIFLVLMVVFFPSSITATPAVPEKRVALVVGNWDYQHSPLINPEYDAAGMAATLDQLGFEVMHRTNLGQTSLHQAIEEFGEKIRGGGVGLFFYAGHGVQVQGKNFLVPPGSEFEDEEDFAKEAVDANTLLKKMGEAKNRLNLVILDACRDNPFADEDDDYDDDYDDSEKKRSLGKKVRSRGVSGSKSKNAGLAQMDAPSGTLLAYSTSPGSTASDGSGRNSPFTHNLLTNMKLPGLTVEQVFKRVRIGVEKATEGEQTPWEVSSLKGDFYFNESKAPSASGSETSSQLEKDLSFWTAVQNSNNPVFFRSYLKKFPKGQFVDLAQWQIKTLSKANKKQDKTKQNVVDLHLEAKQDLMLLSAGKKGGLNVTEKFRTLSEQSPEDRIFSIGLAYAYLKMGKLQQAEKSFKKLTKKKDETLVLQGKEGLAEIRYLNGDMSKAVGLADEVLKSAPTRTMALLVKGKALFQQNRHEEAQKALMTAVEKSAISDFSWQKSEANVALGNLRIQKKELVLAQQSFKKAVIENPFSANAVSNQGVAFQKLGQPKVALGVFKDLKKSHPNDHLAAAFIRQSQAAIAQKKDLERQKYIDGMVQDLVARFKDQKKSSKPRDEWTSPIGAISLLKFKNNTKNSLSGRIGVESVLKDEITRLLTEKGVSVVERDVLDKVMEELKLGSSELANPKTQTKLGKITAAHILSTGSFYDAPKGSVATMRLVETETTDIFLALTKKFMASLNPTELATDWVSQVSSKIKEQFPLKGRIVRVTPNQVIINLGSRHAVRKNMVFNVLSEGEALDLGDGEIEYDYEELGQIKVDRVRNKIAFAKILSQDGTWEKNQKIIVAP